MNQDDLKALVKAIGLQIKKYRKEKNMTQLDLATRADMDVRQIQRLERGHTSATLKTLLKLVSGMDINIFVFFNQLVGSIDGKKTSLIDLPKNTKENHLKKK